ncbi:MAG TPA: hypothetical protein VFS77_18090, partial [Pyrinomonadaceae bacterium]|nr:hypothetical protein [Pyrinomonadaceae bacterium]
MKRALTLILLSLLFLPTATGLTQTPTGVLRLRVRVKAEDSAPQGGLGRKRFYLIPGTIAENKALIDAIASQPLVSRDCYYRKLGASQALIDWLKAGDCESVYCREVEQEFVGGPKAVPEFATAFAASQKEFGGDVTARKWLSTNLEPSIRDGFYKDRQNAISNILKQSVVRSVMTDAKGTAYFTDLGPGTYVISNVIPSEFGQTLITWNCEVQMKPDDLGAEKIYLISNKKDKLVKC